MIEFKVIRYKNFFSYGNQFTELRLDSDKPLCITGFSGSGKSVLLDALSFSLYNKPHRAITKGQIVNSINRKDCLVEVEFSVRGKSYLVRRGIKPNVFEIYQDNELIDQASANKDYQKMLEEDILQMSLKTFSQVVIVSSTNYVPFMQLPTASRRDFIEDVLDLKVFSYMKEDLKERTTNLNSEKLTHDNEISLLETKIELLQKQDSVKEDEIKIEFDELIQEKKDIIAQYRDKFEENKENIETLKKELVDEDSSILNKARTKRQSIVHRKKDCDDTISWFESTETCPTCSQPIEHDHKQSIIDVKKEESEKYRGILLKADAMIASETDKHDFAVDSNKKTNREISKLTGENDSIKGSVSLIKSEILRLETKKNAPRVVRTDNSETITEYNLKIKDLKDKLIRLSEEKESYDIIKKMLGDDGIKETIVNRYIPLMNQKINGYLDKLGLFVSFHLDSEFNETIKSRARDNFSYASFSMGERARIDIAILLMFREIAESKSRASCNLLILDETFDSSLDVEGCNGLMDIIESMKGSVIAISHNNKMIDRFERNINVRKIENFSIQEIVN